MVLTFIYERRKRIEKARAEGYAEGYAEARAKLYAEGIAEGEGRVFAEWTAWNARREEAERGGERFDEPPPSLNGR